MTVYTYEPLDEPVQDDGHPGHYFTVDELRDEQGMNDDGIGPDEAPDDDLERNRDVAEAVIEQWTQVAFIPRRAVEVVGLVPYKLGRPLVREIEAVDDDGTTWTPEQIGDAEIERGWIYGVPAGATVTYTHGYEQPPARIRRAAMIATRVWTLRGPVDDRATQIAVEGATINLATPGLLGSLTGIPEVDAAIAAHAHRSYVG